MAEKRSIHHSGIAFGHLRRAGAVPTTEQAGVHQEGMELVDADSIGPAVGEG